MRSKQRADLGQSKPRLIPFRFSITQNYVLEFGNLYVRFIFQGGYVLETNVNITAATQANPCQITAAGHNYVNGDWVFISGVAGMTQLNGNVFIVANANIGAGTFTLQDTDGNAINSTGYGAYTSGGTVARIYTITSPYAASDLPLLKFTQSADVMSFTHPSYPPNDLKRSGATNWAFTQTSFAAPIAAPATVSGSATVAANPTGNPATLPTSYAYEITAVDFVTGQESVASPVININNSVNMGSTAGGELLGWSAVSGASYYNVYKAPPAYNSNFALANSTTAQPVPVGAPFGLIGSTFGNSFVDTNITAGTQTPPLHLNPFAPGAVQFISVTASSTNWPQTTTVSITTSTGSNFSGAVVLTGGTNSNSNWTIIGVYILNHGQNYAPGDTIVFTGGGTSVTATLTVGPATGTYPGVVAYFQQRRVYAQTLNKPDAIFMSKNGAFTNFDAGNPINANDAITATPWSEQVDGIQWMVSMPLGLVTFTGNGVWQIGASGSFASSPNPITPTNLIAAPQSAVGCNAQVSPVRINWDLLYLQSKGNAVRDLTYQLYFNIYTGIDISWASSHMLIGHQILEWAWCEEPYRLLWMVRDDGVLISLTYLKEQEVKGWARHDTQGQVQSVCSVSEPPVDALYMVVSRGTPTGAKFFIERMDNRIWMSTEDPWCVDNAVSYLPAAQNVAIFSSAATGSALNSVTFTTLSALWSGGNVGQIIRLAGGIAVIDAFVSSTVVTGHWVWPPTILYPNTLPSATIGGWTLGAPLSSIQVSQQLAGITFSGIADGVPIGPIVASATGIVALPFPASNVKLGIPFISQAQSVYLDTGQPTLQTHRKAIPRVGIRVEASCQIQVGTNQVDASTLAPPGIVANWPLAGLGTPQGMVAAPDQGPAYVNPGGQTVQTLFTGDIVVPVASSWNRRGQVAVQQVNPLPLNILAMVPEVLPGDLPENEIRPSQPQQGRGRGAPSMLRRAAMATVIAAASLASSWRPSAW